MTFAYIYQADILCHDCASGVMANLAGVKQHDGQPMAVSEDSDDYPQGPYPDGGGEADCPQHCGECGEFLDNPLTTEGYEYVREALSDYVWRGDGDRDVLAAWFERYSIGLEAPSYAEDCEDEVDFALYIWNEGFALRDGVIQTPGRYEGELVRTVYLHEMIMLGDGDTLYSDSDGSWVEWLELGDDDRDIIGRKCDDDMDAAPCLGARWARVSSTSTGFLHSEVYCAAHAEGYRRVDAESYAGIMELDCETEEEM